MKDCFYWNKMISYNGGWGWINGSDVDLNKSLVFS